MEYLEKTLQFIGFLYRNFWYITSSSYVFMLLLYPNATIELTLVAIHYNNDMLLKFATAFGGVRLFMLFRGNIADAILNGVQGVYELITPPVTIEYDNDVDGIPKEELIDYIIKRQEFKINDVVDHFIIPQYRVERLAKRLEEVNILVRGEQNRRVYNKDYSRSDIALMIKNANTADEIEQLFREKPGGFTTEPTNLPTVSFTKRRLV